jgi:hypothetical protein
MIRGAGPIRWDIIARAGARAGAAGSARSGSAPPRRGPRRSSGQQRVDEPEHRSGQVRPGCHLRRGEAVIVERAPWSGRSPSCQEPLSMWQARSVEVAGNDSGSAPTEKTVQNAQGFGWEPGDNSTDTSPHQARANIGALINIDDDPIRRHTQAAQQLRQRISRRQRCDGTEAAQIQVQLTVGNRPGPARPTGGRARPCPRRPCPRSRR